jgi:hypothetical protein
MKFLLWSAILAFSYLSIKSTTDGLLLILGSDFVTTSWIVALGIQFVIVSSAIKIFRQGGLGKKLIMLSVYILCLLVSVAGSFFYFDRGFNKASRIYRQEVALNTAYINYYHDAMKYLSERKSILDGELAKYEMFLNIEEKHGDVSRVGPSQGPMYRKLRSLTEPIKIYDTAYQKTSKDIDEICDKKFDQKNDEKKDLSYEDKLMITKEKINCISKKLADIPQNNTVQYDINAMYSLLQQLKYNTNILSPKFSESALPSIPDLSSLSSLTTQNQVDYSIKDLFDRNARTILALIFSILLELVILLIAYLLKEEEEADEDFLQASAEITDSSVS